jgi:hypothetical protein
MPEKRAGMDALEQVRRFPTQEIAPTHVISPRIFGVLGATNEFSDGICCDLAGP